MAETPAPPTPESVLESLTRERQAELARELGMTLPASGTRRERAVRMARALRGIRLDFEGLLRTLRREELRRACRAHQLDDSGRSRQELAARLLGRDPAEVDFARWRWTPAEVTDDAAVPPPGALVRVRQRQYLVDEVVPSTGQDEAGARSMTLVRLVCIDDDAPGERLEVLWELELGARVLQPERRGLGEVVRLDEPRHFGAYLHAVRWNCVTATDANLFQAPFRAGIVLMRHQLTPLQKALSLPRANLFIADDVGLGKTIEAGLVVQELILRQRVDRVLIVCPASVTLQWRDEMARRFGLRFALYDRDFVAQRRQERGFGVNPWATHNRFIVSFGLLRRPEHLEPLLEHLGERAARSMLVLDEAHNAAPASRLLYAVDSRLTSVVRDLGRRFDNRLFLSATPHNGHSNSFSALLELLDPQRFTRGDTIDDPARLEPVMVRRLKHDLRESAFATDFPVRRVCRIDIEHQDDDRTWRATWRTGGPEEGAVRALGPGSTAELELAELLRRYAALLGKPGRRTAILLQKRLLSSIHAFRKTLEKHAGVADAAWAAAAADLVDADTWGAAADLDDDDDLVLAARPDDAARPLLERMLELARQHQYRLDARTMALLDWIRRHLCPAAGRVDDATPQERRWTDRRVLIFTEYADTRTYLVQALNRALEGTDRAGERIAVFEGGLDDLARAELQQAFNGDPDTFPLRILIATDAAREGVNLQGHCADLFHYDIPWNPGRLEQRNGRIDRTLQPSPEVRCHYFVYPQRPEDRVLDTLVTKVETIQRELGSLGAVLFEQIADLLDDATADDEQTLRRLEAIGPSDQARQRAAQLERIRANRERITQQVNSAGRILEASRKTLEFEPARLREVIDIGLELMGCPPLRPDGKVFRLPDLPPGFEPLVDELRPPRARDEPFWQWRQRAPLPVVFEPPRTIATDVVQLHLEHPLVRRILDRFRAQGYAAHDLSRVTVLVTPKVDLARAVAYARLSLFGHHGARLHDELIAIAAPWTSPGDPEHLVPRDREFDRQAARLVADTLAAPTPLADIPDGLRARLVASAAGDLQTLWPAIQDEADAIATDARQRLEQRGEQEARLLHDILVATRHRLAAPWQPELQFDADESRLDEHTRRQIQAERDARARRHADLAREIDEEPGRLRELYAVQQRRLEPLGLVYLWPAN